jgi:signal transduction histidine kinase/HD-like signal output (HDOD) protein
MDTHDSNPTPTPDQARRIELLLHQLEALPTLGAIAIRLLELTAVDDSSSDEVIELVSADPSLSSKLLKMCRSGSNRRAAHITTVERAVLHLGFDAVRSAVLSMQVFEIFDAGASPGGEQRDGDTVFSRHAFWHHSIAVAVLCEELAKLMPQRSNVNPHEAFICGLLHDLGLLTLHVLLPRTFDRVCAFSESSGVSIVRACDHVVGITPHTIGRRLAEHWQLPHVIGDVLWLHGQPPQSLPDLPHRPLIELVTLSDAIARAGYVAPVGHHARNEDMRVMSESLGIRTEDVADVAANLARLVGERTDALGLDLPCGTDELLSALSRANASLGRMNRRCLLRSKQAKAHARSLTAITGFHDAAAPGGSVVAVLGKVVRSAAEVFTGGFFATLYQARPSDPWQLMQFSREGEMVRCDIVDPPGESTAVADLADESHVTMQALAMLPWLTSYVSEATDVRDVRLLPLRCGWGVSTVLIHDTVASTGEDAQAVAALSRTWAAAIVAASHHAGAKRLGDQLAESNRELVETRDELMRRKTLASLGEIAAGAAHEMNNPLTVISGRAQILAMRLEDEEQRMMAGQIVEQSHRLSEMITAMRSFAVPVVPDRRPTKLPALLEREVTALAVDRGNCVDVKVLVPDRLPEIAIDPQHLGTALRELLRNGAEAEGSAHIAVSVQIDPLDDRLQVQVADDGAGLSELALDHAFDPFFSDKAAGRQPGLGLATARRLIEANGGTIELENGPERGATATIRLSGWRVESGERRVA